MKTLTLVSAILMIGLLAGCESMEKAESKNATTPEYDQFRYVPLKFKRVSKGFCENCGDQSEYILTFKQLCEIEENKPCRSEVLLILKNIKCKDGKWYNQNVDGSYICDLIK